jgi:hypothetical protein
MTREELLELHYITPIANVSSILARGILSHRRAAGVQHVSVAKQEVQEIRSKVVVPGGKPLHQYANLYICARNPMLFKRKEAHASLAVLRIMHTVLDLPKVVITDQNAASKYARFAASPDGLKIVDRARVFAEYWTDRDDPIAEMRHKSIKCAEVLVPDAVAPEFVAGAYVSCEGSRKELASAAPGLAITIDSHLFFVS